MLENPIKDTFNYQIDIVIPNIDTNFNDLTDLFSSYEYFLLTEISLDRLVDPLFIEAFIKNGSIYMHSFNTKLDCHDCVALLPNGTLTLHLTPKTYERVPIQHKKATAKRSGLLKYEVQIDLTNDKQKLTELVDVFRNYKNTFYVYWEPNSDLISKNVNVYETLKNYFGESCITRCKNRFEKNSFSLYQTELVDKIFNKNDFKSVNSFRQMLNFAGCVFNNIKCENLFPNSTSNQTDRVYVSIFRIKGFYPNKIFQKINEIITKTYDSETVLSIFHGFQDSPVSLYDESFVPHAATRQHQPRQTYSFFTILINHSLK